MGFSYFIEHMEEDEPVVSLPPWVLLEYTQMRLLLPSSSLLNFTSLSKSSLAALQDHFSSNRSEGDVKCTTQSILEFLATRGIEKEKICLLDPKAAQALEPDDAQLFKGFLFGGILGDDPPRDRTSALREMGFPTRHLDEVQMTTDTALGVTKRVIEDGEQLNRIPYVDYPTIRFNAKESVEMPFRYIVGQNNEPILPPGMRELLKEDLNKSFDF